MAVSPPVKSKALKKVQDMLQAGRHEGAPMGRTRADEETESRRCGFFALQIALGHGQLVQVCQQGEAVQILHGGSLWRKSAGLEFSVKITLSKEGFFAIPGSGMRCADRVGLLLSHFSSAISV